MSSNEYQASPDLASILKTLASLAPQNQQQQQGQQTTQATHVTQNPQPLPFSTPPVQPSQQPWQMQPHVQTHTFTPSPKPMPTPTNAIKIIDPATIVDWPTGLKCVMRTVAKHENMIQDIRRMIKIQHENEEQWWKGRQALIERQKDRKENQKKLDEILKAVGGTATTGTSNASPEEMAKELETFDIKVYKAQMQMVKEFTAKLKGLGVPFFGTKSELVRIVKEANGGDGSDDPKDEKGIIDEADLVKLQKRMLAMLEDLCSD